MKLNFGIEGSILPLFLVGILVVTTGCGGVIGQLHDQESRIQFDLVTDTAAPEYTARERRTGIAGAGAASYVGDVNNDRRPDLLLLGGIPSDNGSQRPGLYINTEDGFVESSALPSEVSERGRIIAAHFFDSDNDGWDDLVLFPRGADPIFLENRNGSFEQRHVGLRIPQRSEDGPGGRTRRTDLFEPTTVPTGAASADFDGDGDLDLFVYQNGDWQNTTPKAYQHPNRTIREDNGNRNYLFENTDDGFERLDPDESGISGKHWTLAASFVDLTGDGYPDIHVGNDFGEDILYINQQNGEFERIPMGEATDRNAMSSEIADINRDGRPDIFVTNIYLNESRLTEFGRSYRQNVVGGGLGNNMLINGMNGSFSDHATAYGVAKGGWGWAAVITDFDNDGQLDLVHATQNYGAEFLDRVFEKGDAPTYFRYPALWEGTDTGFRPLNASKHGFESSNSRGLARLDFDRDGDSDLLVTRFSDGKYQLYENVGANGDWLEVTLEGNTSQTPIGARVFVTVNDTTRMGVYNSKADYLSQDSRTLHFGLGDVETIDQLRIVWPDGSEDRYRNVEPNQLIIISINGTMEPY